MGGLDGLIERDEELAALRSAIAAASAGRGRLVVGSAAAGLGKSSLLEAARTLSTEAGLWPLAARGSELERDYPFGAVRQLLDPVLLSHVVGDDARREAVHLAAPLADGTGQEGAADPGYARLHGIYWLLANLAQERPVLVTVDDAHWLDRASLRFLCFLARRLEGLPLLLLVALRPNEALADETLLPELTQRPDALLRPQPLSIDGVAALVGNRLGTMPDSMFARACAATTGGNLFYVRALLGELAERGVSPVAANADLVRGLCPRDVSRYLLRRLATLAPEATAVARAVAVLGDDADTGRLAHLAGLDQRRLADAAHALGSVAIFAQSDRLAFAHPIARTAVYGAIPLAERAEAHGRATRLLLGSGAAPEQVAAQLMGVEAGSQPEAFRVLRRAAASALARGAAEAAATYLRRALDEPLDDAERGPLLAELGRREAQAGLPESGAHLREALARTDLASHAIFRE